MLQQPNTNNDANPSVWGFKTSQPHTKRNYGTMNSQSRILSVLSQANGTLTAVEIAEFANINTETSKRSLRLLAQRGVIQYTMTGAIKNWSIKL